MVRHRILLKVILITIYFSILSLVNPADLLAVTRYVNSDSNGNASNPTRAFDDPSYSANDSYQTLTAAYNAASSGDIIEFSGGTTGKTYQTRNGSLAKASLTFRGSTITNHNGTVTIDYNPAGGDYTFGVNAANITVQNLTLARSGGLGQTVVLYSTNAFFDKVVISNNNGNSPIFVSGGANNNIFQNCVINSLGLSAIQNQLFTSSGTTTFNNCLITGMVYQAFDIYSGVTLNLNNSVIVAAGQNAGCNFRFFSTGAVVNTNNSVIHGGFGAPNTFTCGTGTGTWNSTNDLLGEYPFLQRTKAGFGKFYFAIDDQNNIDYGVTVANFLMDNYEVPVSYFVDTTYSISSTNKTKLQNLVLDGHEIGSHTRHHTDLSQTNALRITYSGSATISLQVGNSGTTLSVIGTGDTHGPIDLTNSAYNTLGEICTLIGTWSNFTCARYVTNVNTLVASTGLKDATTSIAIGTSTAIPFDDDPGPNNRYYKDEITNSITDLESAIRENSSCSDYTVKTFAFPYNFGNSQVINWIRNNTNLIAARSVSTTGTLMERSYLGGINMYNLSMMISTKGAGYTGLSDADKETRIRRAAKSIAASTEQGYIVGYLNHTTAEFNLTEYSWFLDEFLKYTTASNIEINTLSAHANNIRTSGNWTDGGSGLWSRTFAGVDDFRLKFSSPLIGVGTSISGRSSDFYGNSIVDVPDIGIYEFQIPQSSTSLSQFQLGGTSPISVADYSNSSSLILKVYMSSTNPSDSFTPEFEIREVGTSFTNSATNIGNTYLSVGTSIGGSVTITGLSNGNYHWQARTRNVSGASEWLAFGNNQENSTDFIVGSRQLSNSEILSNVEQELISHNQNANLSGHDDPSRAQGVYFSKNNFGKIQFNSPIDLTNSTVVSWLQNIESKLDFSTPGQISLDTDLVDDIINTQATLTLYNINLNEPKILVNFIEDNQSVVTNLNYDRNSKTVTFNVAHFTTFTAVEGQVDSITHSPPSCHDPVPVSAPELFQINTTLHSAKIFFTPISNTSQFFVSFSTTPAAEEFGEQITLTKEGVQSHTIYHLKPNTTYYLKVRGQIGCMPGSWSNILKFTTDNQIFYKYSSSAKSNVAKLSAAKTTKLVKTSTSPIPTITPVIIKVTPAPAQNTTNSNSTPNLWSQLLNLLKFKK